MTSPAPARAAWSLQRSGPSAELALGGDWIARETGIRNGLDVNALVGQVAPADTVVVTMAELGRWDSALIVFLQALADALPASVSMDLSAAPDPVRRLIALARSSEEQPTAGPGRASLLARVGSRAVRRWEETVATTTLVGDLVIRGGAAAVGRGRSRAVDVFELMAEAGAGALGIVAICNGLVGAILAFVGAVQLRRFGAGIYVADLVGIATAREMAAVMTAIVMAGRTGGAYAAHLATMQGNEEIDALQALGIPVVDYLVLPRVFALVAMMPLLYVYGCAVGLFGGFIVSVSILDITPVAFLEQTTRAVAGRHFWFGLGKSVAFGALVALAACRIGLAAGRSAADVGRAATSAVVAGIIGVIALDAVFAVCANALGI